MAQMQKQRRRGVQFETESLGPPHWIALLLAAITGVVHLYLYWTEGFPLFLLGGLGFFGAIALALLLPDYRRYIYLAGIPYTLIFIVGWLAQGMPDFWLGVFDKTVEVLLILFLGYLFVAERRRRDRHVAQT